MTVRFSKKAYRKNISKLSVEELREALVREAELRFNAQAALIKTRALLDMTRIVLTQRINDSLKSLEQIMWERISKGSVCSKPPRKR